MRHTLAAIAFATLRSTAALGQPASTPLVFDMAEVRVTPPTDPWRGGGVIPGGIFEVRGVTRAMRCLPCRPRFRIIRTSPDADSRAMVPKTK